MGWLLFFLLLGQNPRPRLGTRSRAFFRPGVGPFELGNTGAAVTFARASAGNDVWRLDDTALASSLQRNASLVGEPVIIKDSLDSRAKKFGAARWNGFVFEPV